MKDILKKTMLLGLGLGAVTKEKVEKLVKDMQKKGYVNQKEGKKLVGDLMKEAGKKQKQVQSFVEKQIKEAIKAMPLATKKDLKDLEKKLKKKR